MINLFKRKKKKEEPDSTEEQKGIIGRYEEDGFPVVLRFVNEIPSETTTSKMPWFTVVSWKYDGNKRNGMPSESTNIKMIGLENVLESAFGENKICRHAYNRTGNNLKEFNYYITDRDEFLKQFNDALKGHEIYPIEINFYEDPEWVEMNKLLTDFKLKR